MTILLNNSMRIGAIGPLQHIVQPAILYLCTGVVPTDAQVDTLTSSNFSTQTFVAANRAVSYSYPYHSLRAQYDTRQKETVYGYLGAVAQTGTGKLILSTTDIQAGWRYKIPNYLSLLFPYSFNY